MRHVILVGATGLVGSQVLHLLKKRSDVRVTALVRRPMGDESALVVDFEADATFRALACDALFCCVGTTMRKAGSREAFLLVDRDLPLQLLAGLKRSGGGTFAFVSSVGAERPRGFYLRTKAEVEAAIVASGLPHVIARPSLLLGLRSESRPGERVAGAIMPALFGAIDVLGGVVGRRSRAFASYRPVEAIGVARALVAATLDGPAMPRCVIDGDDLAIQSGS